MAYLTEAKLANMLDVPVALASTELKMGDWLLIGTVKIVEPMLLTVRYLNIQLQSCTVDTSKIGNVNRIYGNLGLAYVALRKDYASGSPGQSGAVETLVVSDLGITSRDATKPVYITTPGTYSWLVANNTQASSESSIAATTSIDFKLSVTGQARIYLTTL